MEARGNLMDFFFMFHVRDTVILHSHLEKFTGKTYKQTSFSLVQEPS